MFLNALGKLNLIGMLRHLEVALNIGWWSKFEWWTHRKLEFLVEEKGSQESNE